MDDDEVCEVVWLGPDEGLCFPLPDNPWSGKGWAAYFSGPLEDAGATVYVRFGLMSMVDFDSIDPKLMTPLVVHDLIVRGVGGTAIANVVRGVPLARLEAAANLRLVQQPGLRRPGSYPFNADDTGIPHVRSRWAQRPSTKPRERRPSLKLKIPEDGRRPDRFYGRVAELYLWLASRGKGPAEELAEANGVPVTTVHRWVKEARRREILFPGQRGKGR